MDITKSELLKNQFGYDSFRPGQEEAIDAIAGGRDLIAVMPTGAGKSLCYQIPALLLPGMTIVISPLISLMKDQVHALRENGCSAAYLNSSLSGPEYAQTMEDIDRGEVKLLYIAPERLQRMDLPLLTDSVPLVVIDEAHCVSQWGHDFRTSYLEISGFIKKIKPRPVTAAFTATATPKVREDIERLLRLKDPLSINTGFDRPNLYFEVQKPGEKKAALLDCLDKRKELSGIVYCATRKAVEEVHDLLCHRGFSATRYHAGLEDSERRKNQDDFLYDRKTVMVATNAFGMGIDKSNVSFVIHYNMPKNIESYYQEAGRAGRDGAPADCILLYSGQDVRINEFLITRCDDDDNTPDPELVAHNRELLKQMTFYASGNECLRRRLLSYFGENAPSYCGNCSKCLTEYEETDITLEARKIISCVFRLKERNRSFGKTMIIDILRGSNNEKIKRFGLDSLSVWGIMSEEKAHRIRTILDCLIEEGCLLTEGDEYPVVTLGEGVEEILKEERRLFMKLPKEQKTRLKSKTQTTLHFPHESRPDPQTVSRKTASVPSKPTSQNVDDPLSDNTIDEDTLFEKLKELRKKFATEESVPAYIIFSNATLLDMCRRKPTSLVQFSAVNGVGAVKLEKYGEAFIDVIKSLSR
ncbi:MAG: DNA helicase RecQ [Treponema sp.]|jgi:ATP-dependent DNA helicase RecQ|nr:DNA helicase RecQ [Treponema sp.]